MSKSQLLMQTGTSPGKVFDLSEKEDFLGRDGNNTIIINDAELSRRHCHFVYVDGGFEIEDLGSTNGTFINEKRISGRYRLNYGDIIRLGDNVSLVFELFREDTNATNISRQDTPPSGQPAGVSTPLSSPVPPPPAMSPPSRPPKSIPPPRSAPVSPGKKRPNILLIGCGVFLLIGICILIGGWYYIDTYAPEYYCYFLPILPGCP